MAVLKLDEGLYVAPQLTRADVAGLAALGIGAVICNRPDGEEDGQPTFAQVSLWLKEAGISECRHQPVTARSIGGRDVAEFESLLALSDRPVLAFCRTGTRSSLLWAFARIRQGRDAAGVLAAAKAAGVDLSDFAPRLLEAERGGV
ncbi:MAG: TIGR01244 family sulfur transferase [Neisseria sp.]|nr:TIGR01244 family sulfur transferase [Neisseria sp.]